MARMKVQKKTPEKELNEMEISNTSDVELNKLVIRMLIELIEYSNKIKKTQVEIKVTLCNLTSSCPELGPLSNFSWTCCTHTRPV